MKKTSKPKQTDNTREIAKAIAQAAFDTKAKDIAVLDLRKLSHFTDYFVIATGTSDRQVQAIADNIRDDVEGQKVRPTNVEGYAEGHWVLLDYGTVVAHIFYEETREFYSLEKLWGDAPRVKFRLK